MERDEISGISKEFDQVLKQVSAGVEEKPESQAAIEPVLSDSVLNEPVTERRRSGTGLLHPSDGLIAAFFIPIIIMIVIFAQRGIFPFGEESFLRTDMYHQYAPFFSEFHNKLTHGGSLLYSWDIGMGVNFAALYAYYLASPLNWLLILCPKSLIIEFMTYSIVLKIGLCGLAFAYYLRKHNHTSDFGVGFFGIFYALSGYMAAYSWNIMWLDCILLFPLIMLGLEKLVKEKKGMLYCITLGISILSNYYISIMICVFMVLYFVCLLIMEGKRRPRDFFISLVQFAGYSLIAGALAAVILLPEIFALQSTASVDSSFPKTFEMYFSIFDMLARHIGNVKTETGLDHWPNIYCGVAVYMFFLLYLVCKKIPVKEKTVTCGLLLLFFASFSVNALNFMWHGFHYPNSLPCRQSFIYIFLMLSLCYRAYMYLDETPKKHIAVAFWGSICFILLAQKLVTDKAYHFSVFYAAILFLAIYAGLIYFYKNPRNSKAAAALLTLGVVAIEAAVNTTVTSISTTSRTAYKEDNKDVTELLTDLTSEHGFYRVEKVNRKTKNDGAWMNFPTVSLFSSVAHADLTAFFKSVGCEGSTNAYSITGSTPVVDSLFSVQYALYGGLQDNSRLIFKKSLGDTYLYENPYTLPLGFVMPEEMEENWQIDIPNPIEVQNDLSHVLGTSSVFSEIIGESTGTSFSFTPEEDGEYYIYVLNKKVKSVTVTKSESTKTWDNINRGYLVELGFCPAGEPVTVKNSEDSEELNANAYLFEETGLKEIYEKLNRSPFILTKWDDNILEGVVEAEEAGTAFFSVPYDKGWKIQVDGVPVTARKTFDAFTGIELSAGHHIIKMKYVPEGLKEGAIISAAAIAMLMLLALGGCYLHKKGKEEVK
ncbi:MAG: YfhO family protein [Clostridium sp.]